MPKPDYDTTLARIAGNIAAGAISATSPDIAKTSEIVSMSVRLARAIVAEIKRTTDKDSE